MKGVVPFTLVFLIVAGGWSVRNAISVPADAPGSSDRLLWNLVIGAHSDFHQVWRNDLRDPDNPAVVDAARINGSYSEFLKTMVDRISEDPAHYAQWYLVQKPILLWDWDILTGQGDIYVFPVKYSLYDVSDLALLTYAVMRAAHFWLFGFALLGLFFVFRQPHMPSISASVPIYLYISIVYVSAVYVVTQSEARYSIPLRPEMYLCAVFFITEVLRRVRTLGRGSVTAAVEQR